MFFFKGCISLKASDKRTMVIYISRRYENSLLSLQLFGKFKIISKLSLFLKNAWYVLWLTAMFETESTKKDQRISYHR